MTNVMQVRPPTFGPGPVQGPDLTQAFGTFMREVLARMDLRYPKNDFGGLGNTGQVLSGMSTTIPTWQNALDVKYTAPYPGAVAEKLSARLAQIVSVMDFGATGNGTTDDTAAFTAAGATGKLIYAPAGTYKVGAGITIVGGGLVGDGAYQTHIVTTDTGSSDVFTYTGALAPRFENFQLSASGKSGGYGLTIVGTGSGEISGNRIFQIVLNGLPNGVHFKRASLWSLVASNFYGYTGDAITVDNQNNADSGDSVIANCQFTSPGNTSSNSIHQLESGGLKIIGNKFNNAGVHVLLDLGASPTSDLIITGNSFEGAHFSGIQLQGAANFENVVITGNQFLVSSSSGHSSGVFCNNGSTFLFGLTICGNQFRIDDTGGASAILLDYVTDCTISGNDVLGSGGSSIGIDIGTSNTNLQLGINRVSGCGTNKSIPAAYPTIDPISTAGWGVPTGNAAVAGFSGAGATLLQTSTAVAQIITDLLAAGIYRA